MAEETIREKDDKICSLLSKLEEQQEKWTQKLIENRLANIE